MNRVQSITTKKIGKHKALGLAYTETGEIVIDERLKGFQHLLILIHEIMHVQNPRWGEEKIKGHSEEMARLLWEQHYRKVNNTTSDM